MKNLSEKKKRNGDIINKERDKRKKGSPIVFDVLSRHPW
jgi:hypothetical protein